MFDRLRNKGGGFERTLPHTRPLEALQLCLKFVVVRLDGFQFMAVAPFALPDLDLLRQRTLTFCVTGIQIQPGTL